MGVPHLYSLEGRIGRREFALTLIGIFVATYLMTFVLIVMGGAGYASNAGVRGLWAGVINFLGLAGGCHAAWMTLAAAVKRCHDRSLSGWMLVFAMPPVIGQLWLVLSLVLSRGTAQTRAFGADQATGGLSPAPAVA
ncbi:MAG: DUF805 domain-containing protein [Caulobacter sp.]|nr:DUF805 domain-containing protein [Caulobacter sp.]